jgi:surface antigen
MFGDTKKAAISTMQKQARISGRHVLFLAALLSATIALTPAFAARPTTEKTQQTASKPATKHRLVQPEAPKHSLLQTSGTYHTAMANRLAKSGKVRYAAVSAGISCVPYARAASGITVKGNATNWWANAAGIYERGLRPETGSVLNFRATGRMRLGHVAVVTQVINAREVMIDHANWAGPGLHKGMVSKGVPVIDVSEDNDWSAVRVSLGGGEAFGSVYPTYGFIYDRPDNGTMLANAGERAATRYDEVAEAAPARRTHR